jgi:uncharacterized damage-inducible protein DinB
VRGNTIRVAEDIPAERYDFRATPDTRSVEKILVHVAASPRMQERIHRERVMDFSDVDVPELFSEILGIEAESRSKAEVLELLRAEGDRFAAFLDGLEDLLLEEHVVTPGDPSPTKSRLEMLMGVKEHEMHHRAQLMLIQRMLGVVPHLTRRLEAELGT